MAGKSSGLGDRLLVAGYDLSGDIGSVERVAGGPAALTVTGIDKEAFERIGGLRDGGIDYSAFFNPAAGRAHPRLSSLPTSDQVVTYLRGAALGNAGAAIVAKQLNYDGSRGDDGSLTFTVQAAANDFGLQWGRQLTNGVEAISGASEGTSVDMGFTGSHGLQAFLHVTAFTGTSVTVKLQESSDDGSSDDWADVTGGAFSAATGITAQRIATAADQTVEQYLRAVTTCTFSAATINVVDVVNDTEVDL